VSDEISDTATLGEIYGPALDVTNRDEAKRYFAKLVQRRMRMTGCSLEEARRIERVNIGYFAGYYSDSINHKVKMLYGAVNPMVTTDTVRYH